MDLKSVEFGIIKRLLAFLLPSAVIALNQKLGLNLGVQEIGALVTLAGLFIVQSAATKNAPAAVKDVAEMVAQAAKEVGDASPDLKLSAGK